MNRQSFLYKLDYITEESEHKLRKSPPRLIKIMTHINKGRNKQFWENRAKENNRKLNWS